MPLMSWWWHPPLTSTWCTQHWATLTWTPLRPYYHRTILARFLWHWIRCCGPALPWSNSVVRGFVGSHVWSTLAIFSALSTILDPNDITTMSTTASGWHWPSVQVVLEFFIILMGHLDNKGLLLCVPDALLCQLRDLLFMPHLGPDLMDYIVPISNLSSCIEVKNGILLQWRDLKNWRINHLHQRGGITP